ncbi:hypothetical protein [Streptomyces sp. NPDC057740]
MRTARSRTSFRRSVGAAGGVLRFSEERDPAVLTQFVRFLPKV